MRLFKFSFVPHLSSNSKRDNSAAVGDSDGSNESKSDVDQHKLEGGGHSSLQRSSTLLS